jgi:hypothetical protein
MKIIVYSKTAQEAKRTRRPRAGETLGFRSFEDFTGKAEAGFDDCEILGNDVPSDVAVKIQNAYRPKKKKDD